MREKIIGIVFLLLIGIYPTLALDNLMSLQGVVGDSGQPLNGNLTITMWNQSVGGTKIYDSGTDFNNKIVDGRFDIMIGQVSDLTFEYGKYYYLDMSINGQDQDFNGVERQIFQSSWGMIRKEYVYSTGTWYESEIPSLTESWSGTLHYSKISGALSLNVNNSQYLGGLTKDDLLNNDTQLSNRINLVNSSKAGIGSVQCDGTDKLTNISTTETGISGVCSTDNAGESSDSTMPIPDVLVWGYISPGSAAATTINSAGILSGTATGTVTDSNDNNGRAKNIVSGIVAGNTAKISTTVFAVTRTQFNPMLIVKMSPAEYSTERIWAGFTSAAFPNSDTLGGHGIAVRASTVAGDTTWQFCTRDGVTQSCNNTNIVIAANVSYIFIFNATNTAACVNITNSTGGSTFTCKTTNLPTSTQDLGAESSVITNDTSANNQKFYYMYFMEKTSQQTTPNPTPNIRLWGYVMPGSAATTTINSAGTLSGTATGTVTDSNDNDGRAKNIVSAAANGSAAKISTTVFAVTQTQFNPFFRVKMKPVSYETSIIWVGFTSAAFTNLTTMPGHGISLRGSPDIDTDWQLCSRDGVTQSCVDTNVTITTGAAYDMQFNITSTSACININGGINICKTSNLPTPTQNLGVETSIINTDGVANNQKFYYMYLEQDK